MRLQVSVRPMDQAPADVELGAVAGGAYGRPGESIQSGIATCTGLSILLVDACRSVGIPARVAGTPMWSNLRGNHTWVEIWDGEWHFAGAAEPDAAGLDHGWFVHDATTAKRDVPEHAIYATSFRRTGISFPLVWLPGDK